MSFPQKPQPNNTTLEVERKINSCKTLAELKEVKENNSWRLTGSLNLECIYKAKEDELSRKKPDLSIKQPVLDNTPKGRADLAQDGEGGYLYSMTERGF